MTNHSKPPAPMLASDRPNDADIVFPCMGSTKIDGVRCMVWNGTAYARSGLPIANEFVQAWAREYQHDLHGCDGELIVGQPNDPQCFKNSTGALRRVGGEPDFRFYVFDRASHDATFQARDARLFDHLTDAKVPRVAYVDQTYLHSLEELHTLHSANVLAGFEGTMVRSPFGLYKNGRATTKSQNLFKMKDKTRDEARIVGMERLERNHNDAEVDPHGHTKRSSKKAGKDYVDLCGKLMVEAITGIFTGQRSAVGTGFTDSDRKELYDLWVSGKLLGDIITFEHVPHGSDVKPRHPSFKGRRMQSDMSP